MKKKFPLVRWILKWVVLAGVVLGVSYFIPGISTSGFVVALLVALVLGLINLSIKPLIKVLQLPVNLLTILVFGGGINIGLFWLTGHLVAGFQVIGFLPALWGALITTAVIWVLNELL